MDTDEVEFVRKLVPQWTPDGSNREQIERLGAMILSEPPRWDKQGITNILSALIKKDLSTQERSFLAYLLPIFSGKKVKLPFHEHPFYRLTNGYFAGCEACPRLVKIQCRSDHYYVSGLYFRKRYYECYCADCVESPPEINHPCHQKCPHTLLLRRLTEDTDRNCFLCGERLSWLVYHCSVCKFMIHPFCGRKPVELSANPRKSHKHALTILTRCISFTCDACGLATDACPYICLQCNFMVHKHCIYLPRIIKIMRHQHRLSLTYSRSPEVWSCGVCRQEVDWNYGAYSCNKGCIYAVHSKCATTDEVWDRKDLEGEPKETDDETEDVHPLKRIDEKVIRHFSHREHRLRLNEDGGVCAKTKFCRGCIRPIYSSSFYSCIDCNDFMLHEACANLPRKKPSPLHHHPLTLHARNISVFRFLQDVFQCSTCGQLCSGFQYMCDDENCDMELDVCCASIPEQLSHKGHAHPLFLTSSRQIEKCGVCNRKSIFVFNCFDCRFTLCFRCATLPQTVRYKYDEHPLTLHCGEAASRPYWYARPYWCEICEKRINPNKWFYSCDDCGVTTHVGCAIGSSPYVMPGESFIYKGYQIDTLSNNHPSRPLCHLCCRRCEDTLVFKHIDLYICSFNCLFKCDPDRKLKKKEALVPVSTYTLWQGDEYGLKPTTPNDDLSPREKLKTSPCSPTSSSLPKIAQAVKKEIRFSAKSETEKKEN